MTKKLILPYAKLSNYFFRLFIATINFIRTLIQTISHIDIRSVVDDQMNEFASCSLLFDVTVCICICFVDSTYPSKEFGVDGQWTSSFTFQHHQDMKKQWHRNCCLHSLNIIYNRNILFVWKDVLKHFNVFRHFFHQIVFRFLGFSPLFSQ